ncbi:hypothetical protein CH381_26960 [Leptospira sp. mixed culture ATI2-C-A1]|nr:hypothetical protein CH381_26960 [Leptospira sp. mixed culture ATI2-C-A1]
MQCPKSDLEDSVPIFAVCEITSSLSSGEKAEFDFESLFEEILLKSLFCFRLSHYSITLLFFTHSSVLICSVWDISAKINQRQRVDFIYLLPIFLALILS